MIQRIQSIYLLVGAILASLFTFMNEHTILHIGSLGLRNVSPSILSLIAVVLGLGIIFLFKNRSFQIKLVWLGLALLLAAIGLYVFVDGVQLFFLDWEFYLLPLGMLSLWLAKRAIKSDEDLIRSADRLR